MKKFVAVVLSVAVFTAEVFADDSLVNGAYIKQNAEYADEIAEYEALCGINADIYLIGVKDEYPKSAVLECYANGKVPMLLVSDSVGMGKVSALAEAAAAYDMPMYVCIKGSLDFYRYCAGMFRIKTKNAKLVQAVSMTDYSYAFAGVDIVDYIAINATIGADSIKYPYLYNMIKNADVPVMLDLAVSHYSEKDNRYHTYDALKTINYIYNMKKELGSRLFGINYINIRYKGERFDIYSDEKLRTVYTGKVCEFSKSVFGSTA